MLGGPPYADDQNDALYVKDGARAIQMLTMARNLPSQAYNIGGGAAVTNQELADSIKRIYPFADIDPLPGPPPKGRSYINMDVTRITQDVGWEPAYDQPRHGRVDRLAEDPPGVRAASVAVATMQNLGLHGLGSIWTPKLGHSEK